MNELPEGSVSVPRLCVGARIGAGTTARFFKLFSQVDNETIVIHWPPPSLVPWQALLDVSEQIDQLLAVVDKVCRQGIDTEEIIVDEPIVEMVVKEGRIASIEIKADDQAFQSAFHFFQTLLELARPRALEHAIVRYPTSSSVFQGPTGFCLQFYPSRLFKCSKVRIGQHFLA
jgi:hypothetical protein